MKKKERKIPFKKGDYTKENIEKMFRAANYQRRKIRKLIENEEYMIGNISTHKKIKDVGSLNPNYMALKNRRRKKYKDGEKMLEYYEKVYVEAYEDSLIKGISLLKRNYVSNNTLLNKIESMDALEFFKKFSTNARAEFEFFYIANEDIVEKELLEVWM